jgi:hypothetical protein
MSRTVSVKPIATLTEQCDQCRVWFEFLHPGAGGRDLCSVCIRLEGENRAKNDRPKTVARATVFTSAGQVTR